MSLSKQIHAAPLDLAASKMKRPKNQIAASLVEYGVLVALIAVVAIGAVRVFGENVSTSFSASTSALSNP